MTPPSPRIPTRPQRQVMLLATGVAAAVAIVVAVGWWGDHEVLYRWGLTAAATPWSVIMLGLVVFACTVDRGRARTLAAATTVAMAGAALITPAAAAWLQQLVWPLTTTVSSPGTAYTALMLAAAVLMIGTSEHDLMPEALVVGAAVVAHLSLIGGLLGVDWAASAGTTSPATGLSAPTTLMVLAAAASALTRSPAQQRFGDLGGRRRRETLMVTMFVAAVAPIIVVSAVREQTHATYTAATFSVALAALVASRVVAAADSVDALAAVETMLDASPDATLFVDTDGIIVRVNNRAAALFGWDREDLEGKPIEALVPGTSRDRHRRHREGFTAHPAIRPMGGADSFPAVRRDGTVFPAEVALSPMTIRSHVLIAATVRDATRHREEVDALSRLEQMQSLFLTAVSHELRTPLTVVRGLASTLEARRDDMSPEDVALVVQRLNVNAARLEDLLGDLLDLERLRHGQARERATVTPAAIAARARRVAGELSLDVSISVDDDAPNIRADEVLLVRALHNLLANAGKYAPGPVELHVAASQGGTEIRVEDHGPGVPHHLRELVFEAFERGTFVDSAAPGVGIGLAIVSAFARSGGGSASVGNRRDTERGAAFQVWLPPADRATDVGEPWDPTAQAAAADARAVARMEAGAAEDRRREARRREDNGRMAGQPG